MEKKKRVRPTVGQINELKKQLDEQIEGTSRIVQESHEWREKFRDLKAKWDGIQPDTVEGQRKALIEEAIKLRDETRKIVAENETLKQSNGHMESEMKSLREQVKIAKSNSQVLYEENKKLRDEVKGLKERGFWARVFNR